MPRLARIALVSVLALAFAGSLAATAGTTTRYATRAESISVKPGLAPGLLYEINRVRRAHGLDSVHKSPRLRAAAVAHSRGMALFGYFRHSSVDGAPFWRRIRHWYPDRPYQYWSVGENLLWSTPDVSAREALELWLRSPEHREILLDPRWREVGLSAVHVPEAGGTYGGSEVTIVTADFGVRR